MKKISRCENCEREVYTNYLNLCKRCHQDVGLDFLKKFEAEQTVVEENGASKILEELKAAKPETKTEEQPAEEPQESEEKQEKK